MIAQDPTRDSGSAEPRDVVRYSLLWKLKLCLRAARDPRVRERLPVLLFLCETVDAKTGIGWHSVESIASGSGITERPCRNALVCLRNAGYIERPRSRGGMSKATARYRLTWPEASETGCAQPVKTGCLEPVTYGVQSTEPAVHDRTTGCQQPNNRLSTAPEPAFDPTLEPTRASVPYGTAPDGARAVEGDDFDDLVEEVEVAASPEAKSGHQGQEPDHRADYWREGLAAMRAQGVTEASARGVLGKLVAAVTPVEAVALVRKAIAENVVDLRSYLSAAAKNAAHGRRGARRQRIEPATESEASATLARYGL